MTTKQPKTVLIIDADKTFTAALASRCRQLGLRVTIAHDAIAALGIMDDEGLPHLVCLDLEMPTGNGLSICQMMSSDPDGARVPVVAFSERRDTEVQHRCAGMCVYLVRKTERFAHRFDAFVFELVDLDPAPLALDPDLDRGVYQN